MFDQKSQQRRGATSLHRPAQEIDQLGSFGRRTLFSGESLRKSVIYLETTLLDSTDVDYSGQFEAYDCPNQFDAYTQLISERFITRNPRPAIEDREPLQLRSFGIISRLQSKPLRFILGEICLVIPSHGLVPIALPSPA